MPRLQAAAATDYDRWDLWTPSDEEDDALAACPPANPGIRALERDINQRHQRLPDPTLPLALNPCNSEVAPWRAPSTSATRGCRPRPLEPNRKPYAQHPRPERDI